MIEAICAEIALQKGYLGTNILETVYLGGGTPSLLDEQELGLIFKTIHQYFALAPDAEVTLEANPDDLAAEKILFFNTLGINRLSIGIQSFHTPHLKYLNRTHTASQAERAVKTAQDLGLTNLSIDLIYAIPADNHTIWEQDLAKATTLQINHISAYCLTIEEKTVFGNWLKHQKIPPIEEEFSAQQFEILEQYLTQNDFEQYEISNFARNKAYSRHNSNYWKKGKYLGIGPGAHSYNGVSRQWNIAHNPQYIKTLREEKIPFEIEYLSPTDQLNEYILTGLRTKWGVDLQRIAQEFAVNLRIQQKNIIETLLSQDLITVIDNNLILTKSGKLLADEITTRLLLT